MFGLEEVSGVVCARVKSVAGFGSLKADKEGTVQVLKELTEVVCKAQGEQVRLDEERRQRAQRELPNDSLGDEQTSQLVASLLASTISPLIRNSKPLRSSLRSSPQLHPCMLTSTCRYLGSFAPFINSYCPPQTIVQILTYLELALGHPSSSAETKVEAGKSVRGILLNCTKQLSGTDITTNLLGTLVTTALGTGNSPAILAVAEGGTRLCVQIGGPSGTAGLGVLCNPVLKYIEGTFQQVKELEAGGVDLGQVEAGKRNMAMGLGVLAVVVKYLDGSAPDANGGE